MRLFIFHLFLVALSVGCDNLHRDYSTYNEFVKSSFYKGGWVPDSILLTTSYDIHISNDLDNNKVWLTYSFEKDDKDLSHLLSESPDSCLIAEVRSLFIRYKDRFKTKEAYWYNSDIIFGKMSNNQYYAINASNYQLSYLGLGYSDYNKK